MTEETPKVQAGWVLVPREPTEAMLVGAEVSQAGKRWDPTEIYRAMLAAIPAAPAPSAGEREAFIVWRHGNLAPDDHIAAGVVSIAESAWNGALAWSARAARVPSGGGAVTHYPNTAAARAMPDPCITMQTPGYSRAPYLASDTSLPARLDRLAQKWGDAPHETNLANTLREAAAELRAAGLTEEERLDFRWALDDMKYNGRTAIAGRLEGLYLRLTSARRISTQEDGWLPIETAPDKPMGVFLYTPCEHLWRVAGEPETPYGQDYSIEIAFWDGEDFCEQGTGHSVQERSDAWGGGNGIMPTKWRPLPAPPKEPQP